ncbi:MAG: toxin-antitoxin system TumE family protein [Candidatus Methanospirareceae archaeon]
MRTLKDGSMLYVSEVARAGFRNYSYHWQKRDTVIKRWDNAPHHKELPNFPHRVHGGGEILPGSAVNLIDILVHIETELKRHEV